ncbi:MAG: trigger factor [Rhizobiales bacterium]|nr:trigger factor [Hyphomicrobiales bacterium]
MQVTETLSEGLKREFKVTVPASELDARLNARLDSLKNEVRLKGFRPGKVPVDHLRRLFGKSTMAEIVNDVIGEVARNTISERGERAALQPDFKLSEDEKEADQVLAGKHDLTYTMSYEVLPKVELKDFKSVSVERPVAEVKDEEVDEELRKLAETTRTFTAKDGKAADGDRVTVSYVGKIDGEAFPGGTDENAQIRLGTTQLIPGFAEQIVGMAAGDEKTISVTFPENYGAANLAGKPATFDIKVKEVAGPDELKIDDDLAKKLGLESLEKVRGLIKQQIQNQYGNTSRLRVKRQLLDQLDELHKFELPPTMVEREFDSIWREVNADLKQSGKTFSDEGTTEEAATADYRKIAERRVRLGLVLSEIGERNKIEVTDEEAQRALQAQLRQYPGQEKALIDYYRQNPNALASIRAPIFEEKVVDYLLELVKVTDKPVSREDLMREDEDEKATA